MTASSRQKTGATMPLCTLGSGGWTSQPRQPSWQLQRDREPCLRDYGALACRISRRFVETAAALFLLRSLYEQVANRATQNHPEVHQKALAAQVSASVIFSVVLSGISHRSMKSCPWQEQRDMDTAGTYQNSQDTDMLLSLLALRRKKQYHHLMVTIPGWYQGWDLSVQRSQTQSLQPELESWAGGCKPCWKNCVLRTMVCFVILK